MGIRRMLALIVRLPKVALDIFKSGSLRGQLEEIEREERRRENFKRIRRSNK